jgi:hypothetical protein
MQRHQIVRVLVLSLAFVVIAATGVGVNTAFATCNGGGVCSCGSTVDVNTTLNEAVDPVCSTGPADTCPGNGLTVNAGIVLNLGGCTLRGAPGSNTGVTVGAGGQVSGGKIVGFDTIGVLVSGNGGKVSNLQVSDAPGHGIAILGNGNTVEKSIVRRRHAGGASCVFVNGNGNLVSNVQALECGRHGIAFFGNANTAESSKTHRNLRGIQMQGTGNTATLNRIDDNAEFGIAVAGNDAVVTRNVVLRTAGSCGIVIGQGFTNATVDRNQFKSGAGSEFCVGGSGHTISSNIAAGNGGDGITVDAAGVLFTRNRAAANARFGIQDFDGAANSNTYDANLCSGNDLGDSSPAGLCR